MRGVFDETLMRLRRTSSVKIGLRGLATSESGSVCDTSIFCWRLLEGSVVYEMRQIPSIRLTRGGKGTAFCRTRRRPFRECRLDGWRPPRDLNPPDYKMAR